MTVSTAKHLPKVVLPRHRQRTHQLCGELIKLAHEYGPDAKLPPIAELASRLNASTSTLSDALAELEQRQIVQRIRGVGIFVAPAQPKRVALVCNSNFFLGAEQAAFYDMMLKAASQRAQSHGERFSYHFTIPQEQGESALPADFKEAVQLGMVQGVIAMGLNSTIAQWLDHHNVPTVDFASGGEVRVQIDHSAVARIGVHYLASQACRTVAYWGNHPYHSVVTPALRNFMKNGLAAFREALQETGLDFRYQWVHDPVATAQLGDKCEVTLQEQGYQVAMRVFGEDGERPDGVLITNDVMAAGALAALRRLNVRPGSDVKIATHANAGSPMLIGYESEIARLEVDPREVAAEMFRLLETRMAGEELESSLSMIEPRLVPPK